jgi:probable F420-dependent oxidoreductase
MAQAHDDLRARLGAVGAWTFAFDGRPVAQVANDAAAIESLGYPALWIPEGGGSNDVLTNLSWLLHATERLTVASGIANITAREPEVLARGAAFLTEAFDARLVLGIGVGHEYTTERRGMEWSKPLDRMRSYLDVMDREQERPPAPRVFAALGDGMLRLSAERALGAHTYFVPPEHTARAREVLGPEPVLAVEQGVMITTDADEARRVARAWTVHYLELPNYERNWARLGFGDELEGGGSDRLVDAAIAWGTVEDVVARVRQHREAGADHVCIQPILADDTDLGLPWLRELAPALRSS